MILDRYCISRRQCGTTGIGSTGGNLMQKLFARAGRVLASMSEVAMLLRRSAFSTHYPSVLLSVGHRPPSSLSVYKSPATWIISKAYPYDRDCATGNGAIAIPSLVQRKARMCPASLSYVTATLTIAVTGSSLNEALACLLISDYVHVSSVLRGGLSRAARRRRKADDQLGWELGIPSEQRK